MKNSLMEFDKITSRVAGERALEKGLALYGFTPEYVDPAHDDADEYLDRLRRLATVSEMKRHMDDHGFVFLPKKEQPAMWKVPTWLPVFPGFYDTMFSSDGAEEAELEYINEKRAEKDLPRVEWDALNFDFEEYNDRVARAAADEVMGILTKEEFLDGFDFEGMYSPREYNFKNDSVNIKVLITRDNALNILRNLTEHRYEFSEYLKERYTSYDGFMSFHSNAIEDWMDDFEDTIMDQHKLGSILEFLLNELFNYDAESLALALGDETSVITVKNSYALINPPTLICARCGEPLKAGIPDSADQDELRVEPCSCGTTRLMNYMMQTDPSLGREFQWAFEDGVNTMDAVNVDGEFPVRDLFE